MKSNIILYASANILNLHDNKPSYSKKIIFSLSYQRHTQLTAFPAHILRPYTGLYLTDVGLVKQHHAQTALPDTTPNTEGQLAGQQLPVEIQSGTRLLTLNGKLPDKRITVDTYAHRRQLERTAQHRIPDKYVTVKSHTPVLGHGRPVVIVGRRPCLAHISSSRSFGVISGYIRASSSLCTKVIISGRNGRS